MAGLLGDLVNASRALAAHQTGVQVAGRNIANVNTPGYARQRVILGDRAVVDSRLGPVGSGVEALGVKQIRDSFLDVQVTREGSRTSYLTAKQDAFDKAESALGEQIDRSTDSAILGEASGATTGLASALNSFFAGFDNVSASPSEPAAKQVLLQKADSLVGKFNLADSRLADLQTDLTSQIDSEAGKATDLLGQIADLNRQITIAEVGAPESALALRDQRQSRLEELGQYVNFSSSSIVGSNGQIQISTKDTSGNTVVLVDGADRIGSIGFNGTNFTGPGGVALAVTGGSLGGNLTARDGAIQKLRDDLKTTATQLATAVNRAYNPTAGTGDFFKVPPASGLIELDPALTAANLKTTDTGNSGANEIALAVANLGQKKFSVGSGDLIDGSIGGFYNKVVSGFGETIVGNNATLEDQKIVGDMILQQRDSVSGVSMDEEVTDLMKFQRAYQASSRVISVIDSMLESLINSVR